MDFSSFNHWGESSWLQNKINDESTNSLKYKINVLCSADVAYPFSLPPEGGSTRAALGRKGDLGERDSWEGEGAGPSV